MRTGRLLMIVAVVAFSGVYARAQDVSDEQTAMTRIEQLGGKIIGARPMAVSLSMEPVPSLVIPFWAIVIPLALLSAYLLLSKPRSAKPARPPA